VLEFEYLVLWSYLSNTLYFNNQLNPLNWNFNLWANKLNDGLTILNLECGTLTAREENILKSRLNELGIFSENIINHISNPVSKFSIEGSEKISLIQSRINSFLIECHADSNILERWENVLIESDDILTDLVDNIQKIDQNEFPIIEYGIWGNGYETYFGQFIDDLTDHKKLNNEIDGILNKMLDISLPIYLINYDEPVWVSQQDTLQVIKTIFDSFNQKNLKTSMIVEKSNQVLNDIYRNLKRENIVSFKLPKIDYKISTFKNEFKSTYQSNFSGRYLADFFLPEMNDTNFVINDKILMFHLVNEVFPGKLTLLTQSLKSGKLLNLLQDEIFLGGWELYIQSLLLESNYIKREPELALLLLENRLVAILKLKQQIEYFKSHNNENIQHYSKILFSELAINKLQNKWYNTIPLLDYLIFNEIIDLKNRFLKDDKNNLLQFNDFITQGGAHSIYVRQNLLKH